MLRIASRAKKVTLIYIAATLLFILTACGGEVVSYAPARVTLQSIAVTPAHPGIAISAIKQFTATGTYSNSAVLDITSSVTWSSATPGNATISANGLASGVAVGTTNIQAVLGAITGSTKLTVFLAGSFSIASLSDPLALQQWHLKNTGAGQNAYSDTAGVATMDINVEPVYSSGSGLIIGTGVTVAVVDTGLEIAHEDLNSNVVVEGSWNFINSTTNPTNTATKGDHGTSVAGLIAMARNSVGGIGVAPGASLKGFNFLRSTTSSNEIVSLGGSTASPNSSDVAVFNQSYGYDNTSDFMINTTVEAQYASGTSTLRGGKGALYVKSAGNGFTDFGDPAASCGLLRCRYCNRRFLPECEFRSQQYAALQHRSGRHSCHRG